MGTGLDVQQPLNARRPGAPPLPNFELPAPSFSSSALKYPGQSAHPLNHHQLPPPNPTLIHSQTQPDPVTVAATATSATSATASSNVSSPESTSHWAGSYGSSVRQPWTPNLSSSYSNRDPFSPSFNTSLRNPATSTPGADTISSAYDMNPQLPPYHGPLGTTAAQLSQPMLSATHPSVPSNDPYMTKSSSAPAYGAQLSSPSGPYQFGGGPPPHLSMHQPPRVSSNPPPPPSHLGYPPRPWPSYSLPAMAGPVMSNVQNPGGQMSLMGPMQGGMLPGFNSGHVANMQHLYGGHPPPLHAAGPSNDRPFKCDKCPQSFNRNHDLKRHARIHLAVKPYPCPKCEKQFSRKDALKRHQLVKGCKEEADKARGDVKVEESGGQ
ncbi:hypothetical protein BDW69DRAFT_41633 [Aspergillus filifer]